MWVTEEIKREFIKRSRKRDMNLGIHEDGWPFVSRIRREQRGKEMRSNVNSTAPLVPVKEGLVHRWLGKTTFSETCVQKDG